MWGEVELEPEVREWLEQLDADRFGQVWFYIDLLEREGVGLGFPYTSQLRGKLRELRFYVGTSRLRLTYYIAQGRRFVLLTVFEKTRGQEKAEVERARRAMEKCIAEGHTAEGDGVDELLE